jgi:argonaute-like protein implicated in RNA metabolism and viral defense
VLGASIKKILEPFRRQVKDNSSGMQSPVIEIVKAQSDISQYFEITISQHFESEM